MAEQGPMTEAMYYILLALLRPGHGYGMMQRIRELSGGRLVMGPGTLYGVLSRMNREGLIVLTGEDGRRKNYAITEAGKNALLLDRKMYSSPRSVTYSQPQSANTASCASLILASSRNPGADTSTRYRALAGCGRASLWTTRRKRGGLSTGRSTGL